jgi:hypothetical protein
LSAKEHTDLLHTDVLARIVSSIPDAILATELARRTANARRLDLLSNTAAVTDTPPVRGPPERQADSVTQFCQRYNISRSSLYEQWRQGIGPRFFLVGCSKAHLSAGR